LDALLLAAASAREHAYAPYSKFFVGAAVLRHDGQVFTGANVENASYGLTICAERVALFRAVVACGDPSAARPQNPRVVACAVIGSAAEPVSPCGACRQVIAEFGCRDTAIRFATIAGPHVDTTLGALLPYAFSL